MCYNGEVTKWGCEAWFATQGVKAKFMKAAFGGFPNHQRQLSGFPDLAYQGPFFKTPSEIIQDYLGYFRTHILAHSETRGELRHIQYCLTAPVVNLRHSILNFYAEDRWREESCWPSLSIGLECGPEDRILEHCTTRRSVEPNRTYLRAICRSYVHSRFALLSR